MKTFWVPSLILLLFLSVPGCGDVEVVGRNYASITELNDAGEPGNWIPVFIPESARNIRAKYKIDTGAKLVSFEFVDDNLESLGEHCTPARLGDIDLPPKGYLDVNWWPEALTAGGKSDGYSYQYYRCDRDTFLALSSPNGGVGHYWRIRSQ